MLHPFYSQESPLHSRSAAANEPQTHTTSPIVTGSSVLAVRYRDGVMMTADTAASYGRLSRYRSEQRIHRVHESCVVGASGDISDFQYLQHLLDSLVIRESIHNDGHSLTAKQVYEYLTQVMYARRSRFNPL